MTELEVNEAKEAYIEHITDMFKSTGELTPTISLITYLLTDNSKPAIIHIPIFSKYMDSEKGKDELINDVIPEINKSIKEKFQSPKVVAWASEAWLRKADLNTNIKDFKKIPIDEEVLIISIEEENKTELQVFTIKRKGKEINKEGELIDTITLTKDEELSEIDSSKLTGRFTGLFKKFTK